MGSTTDNAVLVKAAEEFLAAAKGFNGTAGEQTELMRKANTLRFLSEDAGGALFRQWEAMHSIGALATLTSCNVLENIPKAGRIGSKELAEASKLDESVVQRAMGLACVQGIGDEVAPHSYSHNAKSLALIEGDGKYYFQFLLMFNELYLKFPSYFKTHSPEDVNDPRKSPYAWTMGMEGKTYFEAIASNPEHAAIFNRAMIIFEELVPTLGMYPFSELKDQVEAEPNRPFIVDVGGGQGVSLKSIQEEAPGGFGAEMICQDRADVIAGIKDEDIPNITKMAHDFFKPNPIKNAHLYFLRRILHGFNDENCKIILKHVADAMGPKSRLLVGEFILPERAHIGEDFTIRWMNFAMITVTGKERRQKDFEELFDSAGLELVKIWPFQGPGYPQSVIEAKLKDS